MLSYVSYFKWQSFVEGKLQALGKSALKYPHVWLEVTNYVTYS